MLINIGDGTFIDPKKVIYVMPRGDYVIIKFIFTESYITVSPKDGEQKKDVAAWLAKKINDALHLEDKKEAGGMQ